MIDAKRYVPRVCQPDNFGVFARMAEAGVFPTEWAADSPNETWVRSSAYDAKCAEFDRKCEESSSHADDALALHVEVERLTAAYGQLAPVAIELRCEVERLRTSFKDLQHSHDLHAANSERLEAEAERLEARLAAAEASLASDTVAVSALNVELKARLAEEIDARMKWEDEWQKVYAQVAKAERDAERLREDAERWRSLNNDCDAQPCRWPCLRDDLADWTAATSPAPTTATP